MDRISEQPVTAVSTNGYYEQMIKEQTKQIYDLYKRIETLASQKSELVREVERLSKLNKFE